MLIFHFRSQRTSIRKSYLGAGEWLHWMKRLVIIFMVIRAGVLVLVLSVLEYWISCTRTVLILVSSKVIVLVLVLVLMGKYSYEYWQEYWYFMVHLQRKCENHHTCEINSMTYYKGKVPNWFIWLYDTLDVITNSIASFNCIIIEKLTESLLLCLCLLLSFIQVQSPIQLLVNIWKILLQT